MPRFPKSARLLTPSDFERLREKKVQSCGSRHFGLRWRKEKKRRLGIVVSKKVDKAARRNLIKRIVREYFRLRPEQFPLGDVLVIARHDLGGCRRKEIWEAFGAVLKKAQEK